jgi:arylsulfatase A-like enzyme
MKGDAYEGGHRIPFIVRWPAKVAANTVSTATTTLANLMATCADILGLPFPENSVEDSYSILPVLEGKAKTVPNQPAVVHSASNGFFAIRQGDWKLIEGLGSGGFTEPKKIKPTEGGPTGQLYNLDADLAESRDVYTENPEKVKELTELLKKIREGKSQINSLR